ncbi:hypothetical protein QOZ80_5AG0395960 [Eleusine coracana subsp. coracana]|nr:hypothetical protein QOZ80_5AG0395960 [Eleusine coracana subsp. coracana]
MASSACGGAGCGPHCSASSAGAGEDASAEERLGRLSVSGAASAACGKCDGGGAAVAVPGGIGMCGECFRTHLFGKFKLAVTGNAMVRPTDAVLLAFSGGPASRVALQFIHEMQAKAIQSWETSNSQALPVFGVGVAFVDESGVLSPKPKHEVERAVQDIRSIVSSLSPGEKAVHIASLGDMFTSGSEDGVGKLREVVGMIGDETGRDDFLQRSRMLLLQKIALENGYTKIMLGSCASGIACHVLSATVKGHGYSLPADVQYVDTRWDVPVVLPLRDVLAQELSLLCELDSLKTQQLLDRPCRGINSLVASFVARLREENPSREHTILRTAQKLKPFSFNKFSADGYHDFLPSRLRPKFQNVNSDESTFSEILCLICGSPFSESELQNLESTKHNAQKKTDLYTARCCQSCRFQILPSYTDMSEHFFSLLPKFWTEKVNSASGTHSSLRDQIEDYLLEDDDVGK